MFYISKQVPITFGCLGECCNAVFSNFSPLSIGLGFGNVYLLWIPKPHDPLLTSHHYGQ